MNNTLKNMTFEELYTSWKKDTMFCSDSTKISSHIAYLRIISKGLESLPFIFNKLKNENDHWYRALLAITGENPVPNDDAGNLKKMREHWLNWAKERKIIE